MKSIELQNLAWHGDESISLGFPDNWEIHLIGDHLLPALSIEAIQNSILTPIASRPLSALASMHKRALILIDDLTRPTPTKELLPILLNQLFEADLHPDQVTILVAGGTHAPASIDEIQKKVGNSLLSEIRVVAHDCRGALTYLGKTRTGVPLYVNPIVMESDLKIGVGCIYPHPAAGFSGGAKILVPGAVGFQTIRYLHDHFQDAGQRGENVDNEFRVETERIASQIGLDFIVNVAINQKRQISGVFAGDKIHAFRRGVEYVRQAYLVSFQEQADIIIADMYPFDSDLQFAFDRGLWPLESAQKDATKIILASCPMGIGNHQLFPVQNALWTKLRRRLRYLHWRDIKTLSYRLAAARKTVFRKSLGVILVSRGLRKAQLKSVFPSSLVYPDWHSTRVVLEQKYTNRTVKVVIYQCAPLMIPDKNAF